MVLMFSEKLQLYKVKGFHIESPIYFNHSKVLFL